MLLNNNELWDDLDFWYGYKKELTRFDYGSRNMSNETLKRLEENPIINFDIFFILEPYFIDWLKNSHEMNPDNQDSLLAYFNSPHTPYWIYLNSPSFRDMIDVYSYNYYFDKVGAVNGKSVSFLTELEYYLDYWFDWDKLPDYMRDMELDFIAYGMENEGLFDYCNGNVCFKNLFLNPNCRSVISSNDSFKKYDYILSYVELMDQKTWFHASFPMHEDYKQFSVFVFLLNGEI